MANTYCTVLVFGLLCVIVGVWSLEDGTSGSITPKNTCSENEENEQDLCDSTDENKYLEHVESTEIKDEEASSNKEEEESASLDESLAETVKTVKDLEKETFSDVADKQTQNINNVTNEWLGLQIPFVEGVKVGHVQEIEILPGIRRQMKTLSMRPLVFEIPEFLDADECELIIALAEYKKMKENPKKSNNRGIYYEDPHNTFKMWDLNNDDYIDPKEFVLVPGKMDLKFTEENATEMFRKLEMDKDDNGKVDLTEFKGIELEKIREYITGLLNDSSLRRTPSSMMSWLWHDEDELLRYQPELMDGFHERLQSISKIPKEIIRESEPMQVLQFEENSYQYCQQDSEPTFDKVPCCLYGDMQECRICRFMTLTYFLNDVDEGGEMVLPLATNKFEDDIMANSGNWTGFFTFDKTTGSRSPFEVDIEFKMDGANKILSGKGTDEGGSFELFDSLVTDDIIRFRKKYLAKESGNFSIKYVGRLKGNAQMEGKWWVPGLEKMHGFFFMRYKSYEKWIGGALSKCNSHAYCTEGNLVIKPERGKAVMWYNHVINDDGSWIGGLDNIMYYGHCDVTKGEKWIGVNWINVAGDGTNELRAWKRGSNLISETKKHENQNIVQTIGRTAGAVKRDVIEEEFKKDLESEEKWTFEPRPKERHVLNAVVSLLDALGQEDLRTVSKTVHEKLQMLCVPLVLNRGGKISIVDGSKAE